MRSMSPGPRTTAAGLRVIPSAMFMLANRYLAGEDIRVDVAKVRESIERAAEMEHPEANLLKAIALCKGPIGFEKNEELASLQMAEATHSLKHRPVDS